MRIRGYQAKDLEKCRNLWVQLTESHRQIYSDPSIGGRDPSRKFDEHLHRVGHNNVWVAEENGNLIGMAALIPGKSEAELEPVVVDESYRGSRVGRKLVETVLDTARKKTCAYSRQDPSLAIAKRSDSFITEDSESLASWNYSSI